MLDNKVALFMAVAEHGSMRSAAKALYMTQPSLSQQMNQLESDLGVALLRRGPKGIELTEAGRLFFDGAKQISTEADLLVQRVRQLGNQHTGTLRLCGGKNQRQLCLPEVSREFARRYPDIRQSFVTIAAKDIPGGIVSREVDLAEYWSSPALREAGCRWQRGRTYDVALAVPLAHRLANNASISLRDLDDEAVVVNAYGHFDCSDHIRDEMAVSPFSIRLVDANDDEAMENYALGNMMAVTPYPYSFGNAYAMVIPLEITSKIVSGFAYADDPSPETQLFVDLAREMFGD